MDPDDKLSFNSEINAPSWLEGPLISIKVKKPAEQEEVHC